MLQAGFYNLDCMDGMAQFPDKFFQLALVDPPYGQQWGNLQDITSGRTDKMLAFQRQAEKWDSKPTGEYFKELLRVAKG